MEFRLLGPIEVWTGGQRIDLGPRKQRFTLALLALDVNQPIPVSRLVDLTWPQMPPRTARHAIHVGVSRLRAVLAAAADERVRIITRGATYTLQTDPMSVDIYRFRCIVADAQEASADADKIVLLRHALSLWHGPPLADLTGPPVDQLCRGLEETRLATVEKWLETELRLGRHSAIIDQLIEFAAAHPHRQRPVALLMLALYRDGRTPEALRAYRLVQSRLVDEFGLDPHAQLQKLENAILRADPVLDLPQPPFLLAG